MWRRTLDRWPELRESSSALNQEVGPPQGSPRLQCSSADPHTSFPRLPHRSRRSVPRPPPGRPQQRLAPIPPSPGRRRFVPPPRMTDTWPLPCMNKSRPSGHLPKAMPGQLITVNHPPATYERVGAGKQGSRPRNGTVRLWETVHATVVTPTLLLYPIINHSHSDIWLSARVPRA